MGPDGFQQQTVSGSSSSPARSRHRSPTRPPGWSTSRAVRGTRPDQVLPLGQQSPSSAPYRCPSPVTRLATQHTPATRPSSFTHSAPRAPSCHRRTLHVPHRASRRGPLHLPPHDPRLPSRVLRHSPPRGPSRSMHGHRRCRRISHHAPRPSRLARPRHVPRQAPRVSSTCRAGHTPTRRLPAPHHAQHVRAACPITCRASRHVPHHEQ